MPARRPNGRRRPHLPPNVVYRTIVAMGGFAAVEEALGISHRTLLRWRRAGHVPDAQAVLRWAALLHAEPAVQLAAARQLAGLPRLRSAAR